MKYPLEKSQLNKIVGISITTCLEKIDRVRQTGGELLLDLLSSSLIFEDKEKLVYLLNQKINWIDAKEVYPLIIQALDTYYESSVMLGFILCIGGLTESLVRHSSSSLIGYISKSSNRKRKVSKLLAFQLENQTSDRVITPAFATLELLLTTGLIPYENNIFDAFNSKLIKCTKNIKKLLIGVKCLAGFASLFENDLPCRDAKASMNSLLQYLVSSYPKVLNCLNY